MAQPNLYLCTLGGMKRKKTRILIVQAYTAPTFGLCEIMKSNVHLLYSLSTQLSFIQIHNQK